MRGERMTEDSILSVLLAEEDYISGEELAGRLGVTRNSVWKGIRKLRRAGYRIDAATNRGYILRQDEDMLAEPYIRRSLRGAAQKATFEMHATLGSTNNRAKELAAAGAGDFTVVVTNHQDRGKGRLGRSFFSPAGSGIYFSVILRENLGLANAPLITTYAAVAAARAVERLSGGEVQIKWVNDLYMDWKKICGILTEASIDFEGGRLEYAVVGIGINVLHVEFPEEVAKVATTVEDATGAKISRSALIAEILNELSHIGGALRDRTYLEEYRERSIVLGNPVDVYYGNEVFPAVAKVIDDDGALMVETEAGIRKINAGEVSIKLRKPEEK